MFIHNQPTRFKRALALWLIVSHVGALVSPALANPEGGSVASGGMCRASGGGLDRVRLHAQRRRLARRTGAADRPLHLVMGMRGEARHA